uniref:Uncharacterized protein n=1 Tax=Kalanchoe fedtschenkoi TaxID=63787 RepID=A0A7N0TWU1_KALFE
MDLETENRIAMILMKEAAELRRQADREGLQAYLRDPKARGRPNSRFLTATVLGVQQANRAVEVNQMWRLQQKEKELDERIKKRMRDEGHRETNHTSSRRYAVEKVDRVSCSSSRMSREGFSPRDDEGLKDEEIEEFLHARVKRGRGDVGSRMDEPGPYLPSEADRSGPETNFRERWESRILGPEKPISMDNLERAKPDKSDSKRSKSKHPKKHRSKDKPRDKSKKSKEKKKTRRSKHSD